MTNYTITNANTHIKPTSSRPKTEPTPWLSQDRLEPIFVVITLVAIITSLALEAMEASVSLILAVNLISYIAGGTFGTIEGWRSLMEREINVDLLMVLAALGAAVVDQWHEGAILLFLFSLSNVLQAYAMERSRKAITALLDLRPDTATVRRGTDTISVPVEALKVGDIVILQPGERIPIDGKVIRGTSYVDQATITGESMPVQKQIDDEVFAGTLNKNGALDIQVTRLASESTLARIIALVESARDHKAETQRFLDQFEQKYAALVIAATLLLIFVPPLFFGTDFSDNFYQAMVVMVVASPCALVISTPASILSAIANGARHGVLFKGGAHLEELAAIKVVAFDKTGTITSGNPGVTDIISLQGLSEEQLLQIIASVESRSEHPLAQSIVRSAKTRGITITEPTHFEALPGRGLVATYKEQSILVGSERLMREMNIPLPEAIADQRYQFEMEGKTVLFAGDQETCQLMGMVAVLDTPRPESYELVKQLHRVGVQKVVMLTGDNQRVAAAIAAAIGIDEYYAELMPEDKVEKIKTLTQQYGHVAMVGDGVNDAPALASASIGIAMGAAGTDVALETADVVLMSSELQKIPFAIALSKRARRIVWQNIAFSLGVIITLVTIALLPFIELPLPLGVVGHEGSTIIVVTNGLRLLFYRPLLH